MNIEYYILNPSGNITALVTSKALIKDYGLIASKIMEKDKTVEQAGFVDFEGEQPFLRMSGDEFCGNAVMCSAVLYSYLKGKTGEILLNVYGVDSPVKCEVSKTVSGYRAVCTLYCVNSVSTEKFEIDDFCFNAPYISLTGISHIVLQYGFDKKTAEKLIKKYCDCYDLPAMGIMFFDKITKKNVPLVYVKNIDTMIYENSCASGSCALSAFFCDDNEKMDIFHPGGLISTQKAGKGIKLFEEIKITDKYTEVF